MTDNTGNGPLIAVYLVTFRRPEMFKRALLSVVNQTYENIIVRVLNDDPDDNTIREIIDRFCDPRIMLFEPQRRRGATKNFNLLFSENDAEYVSLLEDDNWWDNKFLETMLSVLNERKENIAIGNEILWKEHADGRWENTKKTIWNFSGVKIHKHSLSGLCGHAEIRNSAMLMRVSAAKTWITPDDIPVDVTEHFRERTILSALVMLSDPLVNFAETIRSARDTGNIWGQYQIILIGSVFQALTGAKQRGALAKQLWGECSDKSGPRAVSLVLTGIAIAEARVLLVFAPWVALVRSAFWIGRVPKRLRTVLQAPARLERHLSFLVHAPLTVHLAARFGG